MNAVLEAIALRRSIRNYTDVQITSEQLESLISAAKQAPSAVNRQPYHFTFVLNADVLNEFKKDFDALHMDGDSKLPMGFDVFRGAPCVCFIFCDENGVWPPIDSGIAVENIALAAYSMGLGSVILGMPRDVFTGKDADKWLEKLNAPSGMRFAVAIGLGNPASSKDAHPVREGLIDVIR